MILKTIISIKLPMLTTQNFSAWELNFTLVDPHGVPKHKGSYWLPSGGMPPPTISNPQGWTPRTPQTDTIAQGRPTCCRWVPASAAATNASIRALRPSSVRLGAWNCRRRWGANASTLPAQVQGFPWPVG